jgi:hypothetical protein
VLFVCLFVCLKRGGILIPYSYSTVFVEWHLLSFYSCVVFQLNTLHCSEVQVGDHPGCRYSLSVRCEFTGTGAPYRENSTVFGFWPWSIRSGLLLD